MIPPRRATNRWGNSSLRPSTTRGELAILQPQVREGEGGRDRGRETEGEAEGTEGETAGETEGTEGETEGETIGERDQGETERETTFSYPHP